MHDPVIVSDGNTFERSAIEEWVSRNTFSPVTGAELLRVNGRVLLLPNHTFKALAAHIVAHFQGQ